MVAERDITSLTLPGIADEPIARPNFGLGLIRHSLIADFLGAAR
jgi:hypothetical protein